MRSISLDILPAIVTSISKYLAIKSTVSISALKLMVGFVASLDTIANFCMSSIMKRKAAKGKDIFREEIRAKLLLNRYSLIEDRRLEFSLFYLF